MEIKVLQLADDDTLRRVLCGMVMDRIVVSRISTHWTPGGLFDSQFANLVGGWAVKHVKKYGEAIGRALEPTFDAWAARRAVDDPLVQSVADFLVILSEEYAREAPPLSSEYLLDVAGNYFNRVRLRETLEQANMAMEVEAPLEDVYKLLPGLQRTNLGPGSFIQLAEDFPAWQQAFEEAEQEPLLIYGDRLGRLLTPALVRDSLIGVLASDKMGKSYFLIDVAYRALRQPPLGRRVAYFECGDLGQSEVILRFGQRIMGLPRKQAATVRWPQEGVWKKENWQPNFVEERREACTLRAAYQRYWELSKDGADLLRLSCHRNSSINVEGISEIVAEWEREGWVPDVVCIDYADILSPPNGVEESLDQQDTTWKQLRRLSQEYHCLVVVATQANAEAYRSNGPLRRRNFGGRKTKLAHVSGMLGISRLEGDEDHGVSRIGWVVGRNWKWREGYTVPVAGCWEAGCPFLVSPPVVRRAEAED